MSECSQVSTFCPVEATVYGYYPNLGANVFFCASFAGFTVAQLVFGIRYKTWTWMIATVVGCAMESIGYGGRIMMNRNPFDGGGFKMQIVCLILAPSLLSASIDLTLKHVVLVFGTEKSRIRPNLYTWVFIGLDVASILIQAIGGAIAASGEEDRSLLDMGNNLMLAGIIVQVVQLVAFALVTIDYVVRTRKAFKGRPLPPLGAYYLQSKRFNWFTYAVIGAFSGILIRCIYRSVAIERAGSSESELTGVSWTHAPII